MSLKEALSGGAAVITGAGSGIGAALARQSAQIGLKVVVAELSPERGERIAADIRAAGGEALFVQTDVTKRQSLEALADAAYEAYGDVRLLINNAGVSILGAIWEIGDAEWDRGLGVNLHGVLNGVRAFAPRMLARSAPAYICNVASIASLAMASNAGPYTVAKHAVLSLSECLYIEMQSRPKPVHVSVALPGVVETRILEDTTIASDAYAEQRKAMSRVIAEIGMPVEEAAQIILNGIAAKNFWITTHPEHLKAMAQSRADYLLGQQFPKPAGTEIFDRKN